MEENETQKRICGAKRKRNQGPCCSPFVMPNGRCRIHGGGNTGPNDPAKLEGNQNPKKHGLYSKVLKGTALETYDQARETPERDVAKDVASVLAGKLAAALEDSDEVSGATKVVFDFIDACMARYSLPPGERGEGPTIHPETGALLKRKLRQPALGELAKVATSIKGALEMSAKPVEGNQGQDEDGPQASGVLLLPDVDQDGDDQEQGEE